MKFKTAAVAGALSLACIAQVTLAAGASWVKVGATDVAIGIYVDSNSIVKDGTNVRYSSKNVFKPGHPQNWNHFEVYYLGDCAKSRAQILSYSIIYQDGTVANGEGDGKWEEAKPGTVRGDHLAYACKGSV